MATTTSDGIGIYLFDHLTPWPFWHPVKLLGNLSGAAVLVACVVFAVRRIRERRPGGGNQYEDWLFLALVGKATITGFAAEGLRLADVSPAAYWVYFIHLILVFCLLVFLPYSKFAHVVYRTVVILREGTRDVRQIPS